MIRELFSNLFSTKSTRGRMEYFLVTFSLIAGASLLMTVGIGINIPVLSYPMFFVALLAQVAIWFVVAQRVRDIGWNVPLVLTALLMVSGLSSISGVSENSAFVAVGGPWAIMMTGLLLTVALVPGKNYRAAKGVA